MRQCAVYNAGIVDYEQGVQIQETARALVAAGVWDGILVLLQHSPVITIGRSGGVENLLSNPKLLAKMGVEVTYTDRGGNVTCHNPGQVVGYPIINLSQWQQDAHWYLRTLEEVIITTLSRFGLNADRKKIYTGVWVGDRKIAAIGIAVKKWITSHGFALNVMNDLSLFDLIVPCGIKEFGVTSLEEVYGPTSVDDVLTMLKEDFAQIFKCTLANLSELGVG